MMLGDAHFMQWPMANNVLSLLERQVQALFVGDGGSER
jgi:hypothetical protein